MAKANTNNLLRPQFTTIVADEIEVENASGMGYEGPRMRQLSKEEDGLLRQENPELLKATSGGATPGQVDFYKERATNNIFLESSKEQDARVRANSPFRNLRTWKLMKIIVKSNDDVRQEAFAMQIIN